MSNTSLTEEPGIFENFGFLFYLIDPRKNTFSSIEKCPNYVNQVTPLMAVLIIVEGLVNHFIRGKEQNLADSVTSTVSGLLMTMAGMLTRLVMIQTYDKVHQEYSLISLPWESVITWLATAVLLDLGYYWFHRASHEVGLLWAVHQVHHSSQHFNLTTALR